MLRNLVLIGLLVAGVATQCDAQDRERKYVVGIRSAVITGTMELSGVDPAFDNLPPDGTKGPHMSGVFFLVNVKPYLRVGFETLVSSSDQHERTTMNYQAAGPVVELTYGKTWFVSGGVQAGGLIVNAMARHGDAPPQGASEGSFFKGNGVFVAPTADVGYRFRRTEVGLFVKQVNISGEKSRGGISDFGSSFVGLRLGVRL